METSASPNKTPLRALIVEDHEEDCLLLVDKLKRGGYQVQSARVHTKDDLRGALREPWDIVFCDYSMPTMNGVEALAIVRSADEEVPLIFVSGTIGEDVAVEAMRNGAQDYIMKDNLRRLLPAVNRELEDYQIRKKQRKAEQRLYYLARYDHLTGLPNRFSFIEQLQRTIDRHKRGCDPIAIIHIDIDRFKSINDSFGYEAGNVLLQQVAQRLQRTISKGTTARLATDEFALMISCTPGGGGLDNMLQHVFDALEQPYTIYGLSLYFSASIGVSVFPGDSCSAQELLSNADIAAHRVKDEGGKGFLFYTPSMAVQLEERLTLERNMRVGLEKQEFFLQFQPQVELATGKVVGVEALLRWMNAERGLISPGNFIPLAENTGFILSLGDWVLEQACRQLKQWQSSFQSPLRMAVNVAARQFHNDSLVARLKQLLGKYSLDPCALELEITETSIIRDVEKAIKILKAIQKLGVTVALDDFGTGYSSLSYLKAFKTDYLKIDQSFVRELSGDVESQAIVSAIIAMADKLSIKTIAEGVETQAQYDFLREQGCNIVQGFLISRPVGSDEIFPLL